MQTFATSRSGHNFIREFLIDCGIHLAKDKENPRTPINSSPNNIVIVRDYLNTIAGMTNRDISFMRITIDSYGHVIRKCINPESCPIIKYDDFVWDKNYRINIVEKLGGIYKEDQLTIMAKGGAYSSFDYKISEDHGGKINKFEDATKMTGVNSRWKQILKGSKRDTFIKNLKIDQDVIKLYIDFYDPDEEIMNFLNENVL